MGEVTANQRQVGGNHYETGGIQHWDLFGSEYLIGNATKYLSRWRKKNGVQDLEKAKHYCEKLRERIRLDSDFENTPDRKQFEAWSRDYGLDWVETTIASKIIFWDKIEDIDDAIKGIEMLIAKMTPKPPPPPPSDDEIPGASFQQRTPEDGAQHASLYPWFINNDQYWELYGRTPVIVRFYTYHDENHCLNVHVSSDLLPRELKACYQPCDDGWLLNLANVPEDLRDIYWEGKGWPCRS